MTLTLATFIRPSDPTFRVQVIRRGRKGRELFDVLIRSRDQDRPGSILGFAVEEQAVDYALSVVAK